jgi:hypothetical protein
VVGRSVAIAPTHDLWVQGDTDATFDLGTGPLVPKGTDGFLVRIAP